MLDEKDIRLLHELAADHLAEIGGYSLTPTEDLRQAETTFNRLEGLVWLQTKGRLGRLPFRHQKESATHEH